ncbi:MAG: hypothetical protein K5753_07340 [Clostridia bacterium]|nr:hypothetical protein [Clostridia bacterium]
MKLFGKHVSEKDKKELLMQLLAVVLSGIFVITLGVVSFAWFSQNVSVENSGMQVVVSYETVELLIDRTTEYDDSSRYEGMVGAGGFKSVLAAKEFDFTETYTAEAPLLAYELIVAENTFENKKYLVPGAYGMLTFYIRPKTGHDGDTVFFNLFFEGYANFYEEGQAVSTIQQVTKESVCNLLKGHILFFKERTGAAYADYVYTEQITGGAFNYDMSQHAKCSDPGKTDLYKVTLYWEWPLTYYAIRDDLSTESPATTKKYPTETGAYVANNPLYFYPPSAAIATDEEKTDAYNDGDQLIGDNVEYFVVRIGIV